MHHLPLVTTIAAAFTAAWVLGLITQRLRLSPIVGYLLAGIVIGPHTPGFVGDVGIATQLAEVGVILLMFGVGLHFHLGDLLAVRKVAVPGALGQSLVATLLGLALAVGFGWSLKSGLVLGMAMAVASTVVLMRVLTDNRMLDTPHGHVAVGWLIVEDILTVVLLVILPALGEGSGGGTTQPADPAVAPVTGIGALVWALAKALVKLAALGTILLWGGSKVIPWLMVRVARLRSRELFTLTVLVMAIAVATAAQYLFGASFALGAFLAGMVVGQSAVSHQAAADALPLRDAFSVLFFASVGMLFDPAFLLQEPALVVACLGIVLVAKPLAALAIVALIGYPARTALVVAIGLAQIGEFSFILSELARDHGLLGDAGHNVLVACAIVSITLNPLLFRLVGPAEDALRRWPALWRFMNRRTLRRERAMNEQAGRAVESGSSPLAVILGYGPVGRAVDSVLRDRGVETLVVDLNLDTVQALTGDGRLALYGDAYNIEVMHQALARATHLLITLPHSANRNPLIVSAKLINPDVKVFVRARYLAEREELEQAGADGAIYEEAEAAVALARLVLFDRGADTDTVRRESTRIRQEFTHPDHTPGAAGAPYAHPQPVTAAPRPAT
ncbi:MAG TPA: cation:proton antiporter [Tepidisphaeraceae bacterium]|nr:cation:proton antiporter [Tepidisphaeraceae bacterium]